MSTRNMPELPPERQDPNAWSPYLPTFVGGMPFETYWADRCTIAHVRILQWDRENGYPHERFCDLCRSIVR
jgi:hypothetical protein